MKRVKISLLLVTKKIAKKIGDRKATIAIAIGNLFSNGDRDQDRYLKFDEDRDQDHDRIFRDRTNTLNANAFKKHRRLLSITFKQIVFIP